VFVLELIFKNKKHFKTTMNSGTPSSEPHS
jgi:hypothetical protein